MTRSPRHILLTGYPTFAARYLLKIILEREPESHITCVVLDRHMDEATAGIPDGSEARVTLLTGDVRALDLGLSGKEYLDITRTITDLYHLASIWHMSASRKRLEEVNVQGTLNVLQCARDIEHLARYNHLSTAYICGNRTGVVMEEEFDEGQSFLNPYEQTQFEAERLVRGYLGKLPITIYRPSLIVGHSETGQIDRLNSLYLLMKPLVSLDVPLPMPGSGEAPLNLVPVDYVAEVIYRASIDPRGAGRTFHIVDPNPMSARRVFELVAMTAGKPLPRGRVPVTLPRLMMRIPGLERPLRSGAQLIDNFNRWSLFNAINTAELIRSEPHCPSFPEYVEPIVRYLQDHAFSGDTSPSFDG